ncbi:MAG: hypothetical protein LBL75_02645 [Rickettsiales bacterium]|nr:hypothetical protein [Rickettsiales bacterium]
MKFVAVGQTRVKSKNKFWTQKKSARTWGTVAGVVGSAAIGVIAMELFGNKMIGGAVQGQKSLSEEELLRSQMLDTGRDDDWKKYESAKQELKTACAELKASGGTSPNCL